MKAVGRGHIEGISGKAKTIEAIRKKHGHPGSPEKGPAVRARHIQGQSHPQGGHPEGIVSPNQISNRHRATGKVQGNTVLPHTPDHIPTAHPEGVPGDFQGIDRIHTGKGEKHRYRIGRGPAHHPTPCGQPDSTVTANEVQHSIPVSQKGV
jgi:hypothetical protein